MKRKTLLQTIIPTGEKVPDQVGTQVGINKEDGEIIGQEVLPRVGHGIQTQGGETVGLETNHGVSRC